MSDSDVDMDDSSTKMVYDPDQDPEEKRAVRKNYRKLAKTMEDHQSNLKAVSVETLTRQVQEADLLFDKVKGPQEATLDSAFMLMASSMGTQKARDLKSGSGSFDIDEFVRKLVRFMGGAALADMPVEEEGEDELTDEPMDWEKIGRKALAKSNRVPVTSFMLGPLSAEQKKRGPVKRAKLERNKDDLTKPQELKEEDIARSENETTKNVAYILNALEEAGASNFFQFIINPHDFAQTIENIFYLSFLIRDSLVAFETSEHGEPIIFVVDKDQSLEGGVEAPTKKQIVMEMTMETWRRAIEVFEIKEPKIPQRVAAKTKLGDKWYG